MSQNKPSTVGMRHKVSRPLNGPEIDEANYWFDTQKFKGQVVRDPNFEMTSGTYCQAHFEDNKDLMLFKLTWC